MIVDLYKQCSQASDRGLKQEKNEEDEKKFIIKNRYIKQIHKTEQKMYVSNYPSKLRGIILMDGYLFLYYLWLGF